MEKDSSSDVSFVADVKEEPSSALAAEIQYGDCHFPDRKQDMTSFFPILETDSAPSVLYHVKVELDDPHDSRSVEEEKPCIAALRASVEAYSAKHPRETKDACLESADVMGPSFQENTSSVCDPYSKFIETNQECVSISLPLVSRSTVAERTDENVGELDSNADSAQSSTKPNVYFRDQNLKGLSIRFIEYTVEPVQVDLEENGKDLGASESVAQGMEAGKVSITLHGEESEGPFDFVHNSSKSHSEKDMKWSDHVRKNWHFLCQQTTHVRKKCYTCKLCRKTYKWHSELSRHSRTHTGERPYKCDVCGKGFKWSSALSRHSRTHSGEKPYKCDVCGKCYSQSARLAIHRRTHTGEKPYKCTVCGKSFREKCALAGHNKIHTGERPYKCNVCGTSFKERSALSGHKKIHMGEKPYKCNVCERSFRKHGNLVVHKRIHSGDKPYKIM